MSTKSILLAVEDPESLIGIEEALGRGWEATMVASEADALAQLEQRSFDALLVDFNFGSSDASELLNQAMAKRPEMTRFLLAYEADLALIAAKVEGPHQILPKPIEPASLRNRIEAGVAPEPSRSSESGRDRATAAIASPTVPPVYSDVLKAIELPDKKLVARFIAQDEALTSEVLSLANGAYLGLPRKLTSPAKAVEALGLETVKVLVMSLRFLAENSHLKPGYLSLEQLWAHSKEVALIARDLMLFETKDRTLASQALAAGLVHDLGKVVLASNFDDLYGRVHSLARKQPVALWDVEKEMFGANHGEIGGCLVGMWNLPGYIVDAAALHHEPPLGEQQQLTPLAAVHIADVLAGELRPDNEFRVAPVVHTPFLNELGLVQRLPVWRAALANRGAANVEPEPELAETWQSRAVVPPAGQQSRTANLLPGPDAETRSATSGSAAETPAVSGWGQRRWVYAGVAAGVLLLLALWQGKQLQLEEPLPVYARTAAPAQAPEAVASVPAPGTVAAVVPAAAPATVASEAQNNTPSVPEPAASAVAVAEVSAAPAAPATVTNTPPPTPATKEEAPPEFRLNGITYAVDRPSAIVNRQTVYVGDPVNGAIVVGIGPTTVTLQFKGQRRTYTLN